MSTSIVRPLPYTSVRVLDAEQNRDLRDVCRDRMSVLVQEVPTESQRMSWAPAATPRPLLRSTSQAMDV